MKENELTRIDERWKLLTEGERAGYMKRYADNELSDSAAAAGENRVLEDLFGEHNLKPEPIFKTYEALMHSGYSIETSFGKMGADISVPLSSVDNVGRAKSLLIFLELLKRGYGGEVTNDEWSDGNSEIFVIDYIPYCDKFVVNAVNGANKRKRLSAFHTRKHADDFLSHDSNKDLLRKIFNNA